MNNFLSSARGFFLLFLLFSCSVLADTSWQAQSSHSLAQLLKTNPDNLPELNEPAIINFYQDRQYEPLWSDAKSKLIRAYNLLHILSKADDEGLEPSDYYLEGINRYWNTNEIEAAVHLDLLLSAALYRYSNHVYSGRSSPLDMDADWHIHNEPLDINQMFADIARKQSIAGLLKQLPPRHSAYQLLKKQLHRYRDISLHGGWQKLKWGPVLEPGVQHNQVVQLRQRLNVTGDLVDAPGNDPLLTLDIFDHRLKEAVIHYQKRHGLETDGKVGPNTRRSLNILVEEKIRKILINMERWRWMPRKLERRYLMVNMTGFELYIMDHDSVRMSMPVIIGKLYRSTPSFSGLISTMEYNPYWTIPENMILQDFLPRQISDASFFDNNAINMYRGWGNPQQIDPHTVDWGQIDKENFPYWLRQDPGPKNALGRIKFLFTNPYEIYLHGTPDKHLFERVVRTFSSGCIRVKDPVRLAAYLLNDGSLQMQEEVMQNIYLGTHQEVILPVSVPVYLAYWTAWVDNEAKMNFRPDIYGRDSKLNQIFYNP